MEKTEKQWRSVAWAIWLIPMALVVEIVISNPLARSVTPIYHDAVTNWWAQHPVYTGSSGFNYLPLFLPGFGLFALLPLVICEILWRWAALAGLGFGLWRCTNLIASTNQYKVFALVSVLSLPIGLSSIRNGQSSAQLAACLVLAALLLYRKRWWSATFWLSLALVCKPLAIPAIGLAVMAFPNLWWRALLGTLAVLVAPYFLAPISYVNELYVSFASNMVDCYAPVGRTFADLNGVLRVFGLEVTGVASLVLRVAAGVAMALGIWFTARNTVDIRRVLLWLGFSASYIMLFTPMNEANSYVMLAPAFGLWAAWYFEQREKGMVQAFWFISLSILLFADLVGLALGKDIRNEFDKFWSPFMTLIFLGILVAEMRRIFTESRSRALT